jgi:hypothetical protein
VEEGEEELFCLTSNEYPFLDFTITYSGKKVFSNAF